jgi:fructokinase
MSGLDLESAGASAHAPGAPALFGAIEAGGTKVNMAVGVSATDVFTVARLATTTPEATIEAILDFFEPYRARLTGFGVASFGPVRIDRDAPDWGRLLNTPKPGWPGASFVHPLIERFGLPVALETDVNAAALAEYRLGALRGIKSGAYLTVGTGVGAGFVLDGAPIHGLMHPEVGHVRPLRGGLGEDSFAGCCPYHGDCLEGLASGLAIQRRWGASLSDLPPDHVAHALVADYLGQACATLALALSLERIVIGGGVAQSPGLHAAIAGRMRHWLGGYLTDRRVVGEGFIVEPSLGDKAGLVGAMILSERAAQTPTLATPSSGHQDVLAKT